MDNKKKVILIVIIALVLLLLIITILLILNKDKYVVGTNEEENITTNNVSNTKSSTNSVNNTNTTSNVVLEEEGAEERIYNDVPLDVTNATYFYTVQNCIIKYLESEYTGSYSSFIATIKMMEVNIEDNTIIRYVSRVLIVNRENELEYLNFIVYLDFINRTHEIELIDNSITDLSTVDLKTEITEITSNGDNGYSYILTTTETLLQNYLDTIKELCVNFPEIAYEYLDEEYREEYFKIVESFESYINDNLFLFDDVTLESYEIQSSDENIYLCTTEEGYQCEITETAIMQITFKFVVTNTELTVNVSNEVINYIKDSDGLCTSIKKYIYENGLNNVTTAEFETSELDESTNRLAIVFKLNNEDENRVLIIINLNNNSMEIYDY